MRISVTTLDRFREYLDESDEANAESMLAALRQYITSPPPPTAAMRRGTAVHRVCEHPSSIIPSGAGNDAIISIDEYNFRAGDMRRLLLQLPPTRQSEVPFATTMFGRDFDETITVSGRIDAIDTNAMVGYDIKTRWRKSAVSYYDEQADFDRLHDSAQWKFYTAANGLKFFRYLVVNFTDTDPALLQNVEAIECRPYGAAMQAELDNLVYACAKWITDTGLRQHFKDKQ